MHRIGDWPRTLRLGVLVVALLGFAATALVCGPHALTPIAGEPVSVLTAAAGSSLGVKQTFKHGGYVSAVAISPDSQYLAAGGLLERSISVWNLKTGKLAHRLVPEQGSISALAWSPDSALLASGRDFIRIV